MWAFSMAFDGSNHCGQSFFNLRNLVFYRFDLVNLHLVAIPMFDFHTAEIIFNMILNMDALSDGCRFQQILVSSEGENTMTDWNSGLVTRIVNAAENTCLRIWLPPHQIDLIFKASAEVIDSGAWLKRLYTFVCVPAGAAEPHYLDEHKVPQRGLIYGFTLARCSTSTRCIAEI